MQKLKRGENSWETGKKGYSETLEAREGPTYGAGAFQLYKKKEHVSVSYSLTSRTIFSASIFKVSDY